MTGENQELVVDPDLELGRALGEGGGGGEEGERLIYLPFRLFSILSYLLFLPKIRGAGPPGPSPRYATVIV